MLDRFEQLHALYDELDEFCIKAALKEGLRPPEDNEVLYLNMEASLHDLEGYRQFCIVRIVENLSGEEEQRIDYYFNAERLLGGYV